MAGNSQTGTSPSPDTPFTADDVCNGQVSFPGLAPQEVVRYRTQYGPNILPRARKIPLWRKLLSQLVHFFALMLWAAGGLAIVAGMPQLAFAIFVVIVLNALFAFIQEYRAEKAADRLQRLLPRRVTVIRDNKRENINADDLVPSDVVVLAAGDRIPADMRLMRVNSLAVDTSMLSGESIPATPRPGETIFAGTFAVEGEATAVVTATGHSTRLAQIAAMSTAQPRPQSPLARELDRVVRVIALVSVAVGAAFLAIALLVGISLSDAFLFALGVIVALVPEGLLPTVTLSLAIGAQKMASRGALVRRLESVETLGSTTFICTDKTGTLTSNEMSVAQAWAANAFAYIEGRGYEPIATIHAEQSALSSLRELARAAALHSNGKAALTQGHWKAQGNPLDAALTVFASRLDIDMRAEEIASPSIRRFPFDSRRRRMSVVVGNRVIVRGAPESILNLCRDTGVAEGVIAQMAQHGLRVIAVATRDLDVKQIPETRDAVEKDLVLLGLLGIEDPPRSGVADAIATCRRAGVRVAMITGDHPQTACAIARRVGLWTKESLEMEGKDLPCDEAILGAMMDRDGIVISRVSPEDKLRIARALHKRGHVVAMTGDGVNDAPALHEADIGVAMGLSGTDVAREAADLVLLDDNFTTIVAAIEQGRTTFANTRRFLTYHLTDNVAELTPFVVWALSGGRFPLALGVLQVLCLDIGTDILPAVALGAEPSNPQVLTQPPSGRRLVDSSLLLRAFGVLGLTESIVEMTTFLAVLVSSGWRPGQAFPTGPVLLTASGAAFTAVVAGQMANAFACRSASQWPGKLGWSSNRHLLLAIFCEVGMLFVFLYVPSLANLLGHAAPNTVGYLTAFLAIPAVLLADTAQKHWRRKVGFRNKS